MTASLRRIGVGLCVLALAAIALLTVGIEPTRRALVWAVAPKYTSQPPVTAMVPKLDAPNPQRPLFKIGLERVATGIPEPTDIQFPPGVEGFAVVLEKKGTARWVELATGLHDELFTIKVETQAEEGLLGLAFHPRFGDNGRFFVNYVTRNGDSDVTRIDEWKLSKPTDLRHAEATRTRLLLEVKQPYANHNAGQLAFGPDGMLYIGFGDGGFRDDPHGHGQDASSLLGNMLRIDVDKRGEHTPYAIPPDNPFVGKPGFAPETFAYGLRNPWRYSFDPKGRLIIGDVGQDTWEEIDITGKGDNLGWNVREGWACFQKKEPAKCERTDLVDPVFVYGRGEGASVTGGYVYTGSQIPALHGLYVFGDFISGRLFALALPDDRATHVTTAFTLGHWPLLPSTFGRDAHGELYVASYTTGDIYRFVPAR